MVMEAALVGIKICSEQAWAVQATFQFDNAKDDIDLYFQTDAAISCVELELQDKGYEVKRDSNWRRLA